MTHAIRISIALLLAVLASFIGCWSRDSETNRSPDVYSIHNTGSNQSSVSSQTDAGKQTEEQTYCESVQCKPATCCLSDCDSNSDCCSGTICSKSGRCIPSSCEYCGDLGCAIDESSCTATCNTPTCCMEECNKTADCCAGTYCATSSSGPKKCFPIICDYCSGMTPTCRITSSDDCTAECVPPSTCGEECSTDTECGSGSHCNEFNGGNRKCVPDAYDTMCNLCAPETCWFHSSTCTVTCEEKTVEDPEDVVSELEITDEPTCDGECIACCGRCDLEKDCCCGGTYCGMSSSGVMLCRPDLCRHCEYGCSFVCPD